MTIVEIGIALALIVGLFTWLASATTVALVRRPSVYQVCSSG